MKKLYGYVCVGELFIVKVAFVSLVLLVFIAAFTRYIGYPINWSVDMAQCLFAWCTFLAADIAMRGNKLMRVDFFVEKLPEHYKNKIELLNLIIILFFFDGPYRLRFLAQLHDPFQNLSGHSRFQLHLGYPQRTDRQSAHVHHHCAEHQDNA